MTPHMILRERVDLVVAHRQFVGLIVALLVAGFFASAPAARAGEANSLCPTGFDEQRNSGLSFDDVGCSLCSEAGCNEFCLTVPVMLCPPGPSPENTACCNANPCNGNCPDPKPPLCSFQNCQCEPEGCCFVVCPNPTAAPAMTAYGLGATTAALAAVGALYARRRRSRSSEAA